MVVLQWFFNALVVFIVAYVLVRLVGKRAMARMSGYDMVVYIVSGSFFAQAMLNTDRIVQVTVTSAFFFGLYYLFTRLMLRNKVDALLHQKPTVLIWQGNISEIGLKKTRTTVQELLGELRIKGYASAADVEFAIMEESGRISVIPKADKQPVTRRDMGMTAPPETLPVPLVIDGELIEENLRFLERDRMWLLGKLSQQGMTAADIPSLTLVQVEGNGQLTIDRNEVRLAAKGSDKSQYRSHDQSLTAVVPESDANLPISQAVKDALNRAEDEQT